MAAQGQVAEADRQELWALQELQAWRQQQAELQVWQQQQVEQQQELQVQLVQAQSVVQQLQQALSRAEGELAAHRCVRTDGWMHGWDGMGWKQRVCCCCPSHCCAAAAVACMMMGLLLLLPVWC